MKPLLLLDNYDSFTYNLHDYLLQLGKHCVIIRNDEARVNELSAAQYDGVVISPGPKTPHEAGITMGMIEAWHEYLPILGICLGHQALGLFFGGRVVRAARPVHGKTSLVEHARHPLFEGIPSPFEVMRYHSLILQETDTMKMEVIARTTDGEIMAIAHDTLPIAGVQFHPESVLTSHGKQVLDNWLKWSSVLHQGGGQFFG